MPFTPEKITREHVLQAVNRIESLGLELKPSTRYDVLINNKAYPPKGIMAVAHEVMNGERIWKVKGGGPTNRYLREFGFKVQKKSMPALQTLPSITGVVFKLGCNWGTGKKSFYNLIKERKIIISDRQFSVGDLVLIAEGHQALAIAMVTAPMRPVTGDSSLEQPFTDHEIEYESWVLYGRSEWYELKEQEKFLYRLQQGIVMVQDPKVRENVISLWKNRSENAPDAGAQSKNMGHSLNTILYGPPGTGKTYNAINHALSIIHSKDVSQITAPREELKQEFDSYVKSGQIVFTTFHQSLSYEDFIEGIKPKTQNNTIVYEVEDGMFKSFCNRARFISGNFEEVLAKFKAVLIEAGDENKYSIKAKTTEFYITYRGTNVFYIRPHSSTKQDAWYPVNIDNIRKAFETDSYVNIYNFTYVREVISHLKDKFSLVKGNNQNTEKKNFVFIIDEINRGNVSQIFGELITLIEDSKREGAPEELSVELPYSKQAFSVPGNVYILGTMNTADRSVEALDTALRRRFNFVFMPPDVTCIEESAELLSKNISLRKLLGTINDRLKYLIDEDHQLGHSYFLGIKTAEQLRHVFKNKVVPLLKEYFYNDYQKLLLVLGPGFVEKKSAKPGFAAEDSEIDREIFQVLPITKEFDIITAINDLG